MLLKKVYRVLKFEQEPFLKPYIEKNTALRTQATNEFEKDFYKLLNNAIYGKTLESVMNRVEIKFIKKGNNRGSRELNIETLTANPFFHSFQIYDEDFAIVQMKKSSIEFNKPIIIGYSVLEISKTFMYDFHYNVMKPNYNNNLSLLYCDTDSFIYLIQTNDFYTDLKTKLKNYFDTSNFSQTNQFGVLPLN